MGDHFEMSDKIYKINHSTRVSDANGKEISKVQPYITCYMWKRIKSVSYTHLDVYKRQDGSLKLCLNL